VSLKGLSQFEKSKRSLKLRRQMRRYEFTRDLYQTFFKLIEGDPTEVEHEILGKVEVPTNLELK
jgi:hypothetical protein